MPGARISLEHMWRIRPICGYLFGVDVFDDGLGWEELQFALVIAGSGQMALPVDNASHLTRLTLQGARDRGWEFEEAWAAAMARLQPSQAGGEVDLLQAASLREDRQLLEEDKPFFRAVYEEREPTVMERAQVLARATSRLEAGDHADRAARAIAVVPERPLAA